MIRTILICLICSISHQIAAQSITQQPAQWLNWSEQVQPQMQRIQATSDTAWIKEQVGIHLVKQWQKQSKLGVHTYYQQMYKELPVWGGYIKTDALTSGEVCITKHLLFPSTETATVPSSSQTHWVVTPQGYIGAVVTVEDGIEKITSTQGEVWRMQDIKRYLDHEDTLVSGKVFAPDPLSSAGVIYGQDGIWLHYSDSDLAIINNERIDVTFPVTLEGDSFVLESGFARILDFRAPFMGITKTKNPEFYFTRKTQGFKNVMAYYHIYRTREYVRTLGFDIMHYPIRVDASASTGDNSFFNFSPDTSLNFGLGGVPDAEDADVIVHEYTHAVSYDINPTRNMVTERLSIEEGMCDVMAAIRSKFYTPFNYRRIFNYDGPNPVAQGYFAFWPGRNGQSTKTYENRLGSVYADSEIWTSCMLDISEAISPDTLMDIMLSSISLLNQNSTMPQACEAMLLTDSLLYEGKHNLTMGIYFNQRKFGNFPVGLKEQLPFNSAFHIHGMQSYANGMGPLTLISKSLKPFRILVFNSQGGLVYASDWANGTLDLQPEDYRSGVYHIRVEQEGEAFHTRIIRF